MQNCVASALGTARAASFIAAQIVVLWSINLGASAVVTRLHLPIPGNVLGLALLFALLRCGAVKVVWLESAALLLVKHLAFFFIPITVGIMSMGRLFALHGWGIACILVVSAAVGIALSGLTSERMMRARKRSAARPRTEMNV